VIQDIYNPQNLNRYAYVLNNPLKYIDPSGNEVRIYIHKTEGGRINVVMTATIEIRGTGANSTFANKIKQALEKKYKGNIGKYNVRMTADVTVRDGGKVNDPKRHQMEVKQVTEWTKSRAQVSGNEASLDSLDSEGVIAHEFAHNLGVHDERKEWGQSLNSE